MRKSILMLVALCVFSLHAMGQTSAGQLFAGGSFNISTNTTSTTVGGVTQQGDRDFNFNLGPSVGYFIADNIAIGARLTFDIDRSFSRTDDSWVGANSVGLRPFARYYVEMTDKVFVFGQADAGFATGRGRSSDGTNTVVGQRNNSLGVSLGGGIALFPFDQISVDIGFNLLNFSYAGNENVSSPSFRFGLNTLAPNLGVRYFF